MTWKGLIRAVFDKMYNFIENCSEQAIPGLFFMIPRLDPLKHVLKSLNCSNHRNLIGKVKNSMTPTLQAKCGIPH